MHVRRGGRVTGRPVGVPAEVDVYVGALECDVLLGDVRSLKQKRSAVRPLLAELRRLDVAVAEAGHRDLYRRTLIGVSCVSGDAGHVTALLERCERLVAAHPGTELLSTRTRLFGPEDDEEPGDAPGGGA